MMIRSPINAHLWWLIPAGAALSTVAAVRTVSGLVGVTLVVMLLEGLLIRTFLRTGIERAMAALPLMLFVLLSGGVLLFLERMIFKLPFIVCVYGLLGFVHFGLRSCALHPGADMRIISRDGFRLIAHASVFLTGVIFFAVIFYFGISSALIIAPILFLPLVQNVFLSWFERMPMRERLLHAISLEIIMLETVAVLMFLPVAYGVSALMLLLVHFLYSEYVMERTGSERVSPHHNDLTLSFIIVGIVVALVLLIAQWR